MIKNNNTSFFSLNPEKSLIEQPVFRLVNILLITFSLILTIIIYIKGNYAFEWSPFGFNYFLSQFSFPLSILALTIPINIIIATLHRSIQTNTQIDLLSQQHNFANYYKHYEMFKIYYNDLSEQYKILKNVKSSIIYKRLFPNSRKGIYHVDKHLLFEITNLSKEYLQLLERMNEESNVTYLDFVMISSDIILNLSNAWGGYWLTPKDFGNTFMENITGIDSDKVKTATYGNLSCKFIKADTEDIIFEKVVKYFSLIAKLIEFEIDLETSDDVSYLNKLINKEVLLVNTEVDKRIASRFISMFIRTKENKF